MKLNLTCFFLFFSETTREFETTCVACIILPLHTADLDNLKIIRIEPWPENGQNKTNFLKVFAEKTG